MSIARSLDQRSKGAPVHLNHLNLAVDDVEETSAFLRAYFGLQAVHGAPATSRMRILRDDAGCVLTLMHLPDDPPAAYPGTFHIGFVQPEPAAVDALHQRLVGDGFDVAPPRRFHGSWTFYVRAPGGVLVEVLA